MGAVTARRVAYRSDEAAISVDHRWLQAGFSSFAYRLAHLTVPRAPLSAALLAIFYLI